MSESCVTSLQLRCEPDDVILILTTEQPEILGALEIAVSGAGPMSRQRSVTITHEND